MSHNCSLIIFIDALACFLADYRVDDRVVFHAVSKRHGKSRGAVKLPPTMLKQIGEFSSLLEELFASLEESFFSLVLLAIYFVDAERRRLPCLCRNILQSGAHADQQHKTLPGAHSCVHVAIVNWPIFGRITTTKRSCVNSCLLEELYITCSSREGTIPYLLSPTLSRAAE